MHDGKLEFVVTNVDNARRYQGGQVFKYCGTTSSDGAERTAQAVGPPPKQDDGQTLRTGARLCPADLTTRTGAAGTASGNGD